MKYFLFCISILCIVLSVPLSVFAEEVRIDAVNEESRVGDEFVLDVKIATKEHINAIEGYIDYDEEEIVLKEVYLGDSVIQFWVKQPAFDAGLISFSGVSPSGFSGANNQLFRMVMIAKKEGIHVISPKNIKIYVNDGKGTIAKVSEHAIRMTVKPAVREEALSYRDGDSEPPEDFTPSILENSLLLDGKKALVFATQDKGVGLSRYEIKEGIFGWYHNAVSPYALKYQDFSRTIYIRAIDKNGNERTVVVPAAGRAPWYTYAEYWIAFSLVSFLFGGGYVIWKKLAN